MNPFTAHTRAQGLTYIQHWWFAMSVAWRLFSSVIAFSLHAMFPFVHIARSLDFEATIEFIHGKNTWLEQVKSEKRCASSKDNKYLAA
jgi:hypothetical protein